MALAAPQSESPSLKWLVLLTVIVGTFLGRLDQTIVNLALPKIIDDFSITVTSAAWIATAYILTNAIFVPVWGKLGDTIGRKKVYLMGFAIFIFGSVLAGLSWNLGSMVVFRVIQAIASSADYPTAMAILAVTFPGPKERAQALGIWSSAFAAASVFGPLIGGPLIDNFGWRSVFLVNLPVGIIGLAMAIIFVKESVSEVKTKYFDWWGAITLGVSLSAIVLVLDRGLDWGWLSVNSLASYATALIFMLVFVVIEWNHPEPIVDFKFFRNSVFVSTLVNNFIVFMAMLGGVFLIPIFAETFLGYGATQTGYLFLPMAAGLMIGAPLGASLVGKVPARYIVAASTAAAAISLYFLRFIDPRSTAVDIMIPIGFMAFSMGFGMPQRTSAIASAVPQSEIGVASSVLALVRNIAGAFGIAIFGTILTNVTESNVLNIARSSTVHVTNPFVMHQFTGLIILKAQVSAYGTVFALSAGVLMIGALLALWIRDADEKPTQEMMMLE